MTEAILSAIAAPSTLPRQSLVIGVVNNMPLAARQATMRQFTQLLHAAASEHDVALKFYRAGSRDDAVEADSDTVFDAEHDGLIVTGAEPRTVCLVDDPVWPLVTQLADSAEETGTPVIWSCLAAHVAVMHLDRIDRIPLSEKISGVFVAEVQATGHRLLADLHDGWKAPHSRCNTLSEDDLTSHGYTILVRSEEAGVDLFERRGRAPFLFVQSHPEYDADTLMREFQRDLRRFHLGERPMPPNLPNGYSGQATWRQQAVILYSNWLRELAARKVFRDALGLVAGQQTSRVRQLASDLLPC